MRYKKGFSVLEALLATALFVVIASSLTELIIQGTRLSGNTDESAIAVSYATGGLEALASIRNQSYDALINSNGTGIVKNGSNVWDFSGTNNTFDKYTRTLTISAVQRDGSGNIIASGGTVDPDTKKVTSTVTWNSSMSQPKTITYTKYLTNFRKPLLFDGGILAYFNGTSIPRFRTYTSSTNIFDTPIDGPTGSTGRSVVVETSPKKHEAIAAYTSNAGALQVLCFNGTTWSNEWSATVGGTSTTRRFDIAYETSTGNAIVVYSTNTATNNELAFRTKSSSAACGSWSAETIFSSARTTGTVQWVLLASDRRTNSNTVAALWADSNADLSAMLWNGSSWVNEPGAALETNTEYITAAQDTMSFDIDYESLSGNLMVLWGNRAGGNGTNGVRYARCTGGGSGCSWTAATTPAGFSDDATGLDIASNPLSNEIAFASIGNAGSDLQIGYWDGSTWTARANVDTSCTAPTAGSKGVAATWLIAGATTRSVVVYDDSGATVVNWYAGNGSTFTLQADWTPTPRFASIQRWLDLETNPNNNSQAMLPLVDGANDLTAKRIAMTSVPAFTWSNSGTVLDAGLPQAISQPFSFAYWHY